MIDVILALWLLAGIGVVALYHHSGFRFVVRWDETVRREVDRDSIRGAA